MSDTYEGPGVLFGTPKRYGQLAVELSREEDTKIVDFRPVAERVGIDADTAATLIQSFIQSKFWKKESEFTGTLTSSGRQYAKDLVLKVERLKLAEEQRVINARKANAFAEQQNRIELESRRRKQKEEKRAKIRAYWLERFDRVIWKAIEIGFTTACASMIAVYVIDSKKTDVPERGTAPEHNTTSQPATQPQPLLNAMNRQQVRRNQDTDSFAFGIALARV